jgi:hypothetical protein
MHVLEWPWREPPPSRLADLPPAQAAALAEYRRYVETTATARLKSVASSDVPQGTAAVVHVGHGKPYEQLLGAAREDGADLIVLGVHGRSAGPGRLRVDDESVGASGHVPGADSPRLSKKGAPTARRPARYSSQHRDLSAMGYRSFGPPGKARVRKLTILT